MKVKQTYNQTATLNDSSMLDEYPEMSKNVLN